MDNKVKARIINALRAISRSWKPRLAAKNKAKVAPATFACSQCGVWVYEGKSKKAVDEICTKLEKRVIMDKIHMDHIESVVPLDGWRDWEHFSTSIIGRMFCEENNFNPLCATCHALKTDQESKVRKHHRALNKAKKKEIT